LLSESTLAFQGEVRQTASEETQQKACSASGSLAGCRTEIQAQICYAIVLCNRNHL